MKGGGQLYIVGRQRDTDMSRLQDLQHFQQEPQQLKQDKNRNKRHARLFLQGPLQAGSWNR